MRDTLTAGFLVVVLALAAAGFVSETRRDRSDDRWVPRDRRDVVDGLGLVDAPPPAPGSVVALSYGRISAQPLDGDVAVGDFAEHVAALRSVGAQFANAETIEDVLSGSPDGEPLTVAILIEDTSVAVWRDVDPVLEAYGARAVAVLDPDDIVARGPSSRLTRSMVGELAQSGRWDMAVRSRGPLPLDDPPRITVGPVGVGRQRGIHFDGFGPYAASKGSAPGPLTRIRVEPGTSPSEVMGLVGRSLPRPPTGLDVLDAVGDDRCNVGRHTVAVTGAGYARCRFDGNDATWTDYVVSTSVRRESGDTAVVIVRDDGDGRVELAIGNVEATLRVVQAGAVSVLDTVELREQEGVHDVSLEVVGRTVRAVVDDRRLGPSTAPGVPVRGIVGFAAAGTTPTAVRFSQIQIAPFRVLASDHSMSRIPER